MRRMPETPAVSFAQLSDLPTPSEVTTPMPVTAMTGRPALSTIVAALAMTLSLNRPVRSAPALRRANCLRWSRQPGTGGRTVADVSAARRREQLAMFDGRTGDGEAWRRTGRRHHVRYTCPVLRTGRPMSLSTASSADVAGSTPLAPEMMAACSESTPGAIAFHSRRRVDSISPGWRSPRVGEDRTDARARAARRAPPHGRGFPAPGMRPCVASVDAALRTAIPNRSERRA